MSEIIISREYNDTYGNTINITNGIIELSASIDFGPRILNYCLKGKENMLYNDKEKNPINDKAFPEFDGDIFKIYGGHRLWISPEILPRCYYPDNFPVKAIETKTGVILEAPPEKVNNIQKIIEIRINEYNSEVELIHTIKNVGMWDIIFAPWALTVMAQGGVEVIPQGDRATGLLCNRFVALWPYTKMCDDRIYWGENYIVLKQDASNEDKVKIGINNEKEWAAYFNKEQLFIKRYNHIVDGFYPDFSGCSYETYTDKKILEMESLGQIGVVEPGSAATHIEKWMLFEETFLPDKDEQKINDVISKYI